jgi:predicted RNA methylase
MKLSKKDKKKNDEVLKLLELSALTHDQKCKIYEDLNEGIFGDITSHSAYFTGLDLALDFALMAPTDGLVLDMCAGFGVLSFAALTRDYYEGNIKKIICLERNPKYIEVGKKLVQSVYKRSWDVDKEKQELQTEVIWIQGDMFDKKLWDKIEKEHGKIDCLLSNPPFGKVTKTDCDRSWLKYKGSDLDIAALEIGYHKAEYASFILPQGSCTFRGSGRHALGGFEHVENKKVAKLKKEAEIDFYMSWLSIDTSVYEQNFKNTTIPVECCTLDKEY